MSGVNVRLLSRSLRRAPLSPFHAQSKLVLIVLNPLGVVLAILCNCAICAFLGFHPMTLAQKLSLHWHNSECAIVQLSITSHSLCCTLLHIHQPYPIWQPHRQSCQLMIRIIPAAPSPHPTLTSPSLMLQLPTHTAISTLVMLHQH